MITKVITCPSFPLASVSVFTRNYRPVSRLLFRFEAAGSLGQMTTQRILRFGHFSQNTYLTRAPAGLYVVFAFTNMNFKLEDFGYHHLSREQGQKSIRESHESEIRLEVDVQRIRFSSALVDEICTLFERNSVARTLRGQESENRDRLGTSPFDRPTNEKQGNLPAYFGGSEREKSRANGGILRSQRIWLRKVRPSGPQVKQK